MDQLVKFIQSIYQHETPSGKTILELSSFNGFPLWWTSDTLFYASLMRNLSENKEKNSLPFNYHRFLNLYRFFGIYAELLYDIFLKYLIKFIEKIFPVSPQIEAPKILFISQDRQWRRVKNHHTGKMEKKDVFFGPVLDYLENYHLTGFYPIDLYPVRGLKVFLDKRRHGDIEHHPLNRYWSFDFWKKQRSALKEFKKSLEIIKNDESFKKTCNYQGIDLHSEIIKELEVYFLVLYPHLVKFVYMAQEMIKKEDPELILLLNEFAYWERSLMMAAKKEGTKTLAFQHGIIFPGQRNYMYLPDEISKEPDDLKCPLADHTLVYGSFYRDILTQISSFSPESVLDLGQPRYDILYHAPELYSPTDFREKYAIPEENKIVLWTTQSFFLSDDENQDNISTILESIKNLEHVTLIIKPHPLDQKKHDQMIETIAQEYNFNYLIIKDVETLELIYNCDVMITKDSTTALEAVALDKPLIILNLSGKKDKVDYVENKVASGVYNSLDLSPAILDLLTTDTLASFRSDYVEKYLHHIDGKASWRIARFIKEIMGQLNNK